MQDMIALPLGKGSAIELMQKDEELLNAQKQAPVLHVYLLDSPSITYGHFIKPETWIDLAKADAKGVSYAKRPTGGGLLLHGSDIAFSITFPNSHPLYSFEPLARYQTINKCVVEAIEKSFSGATLSLYHQLSKTANRLVTAGVSESGQTIIFEKQVCLACKTMYDILFEGKKVGGAAQRKTKEALLHQGYIQLYPINKSLFETVLPSLDLWEKIEAVSTQILPCHQTSREEAAALFREVFSYVLHQFLEIYSLSKTDS